MNEYSYEVWVRFKRTACPNDPWEYDDIFIGTGKNAAEVLERAKNDFSRISCDGFDYQIRNLQKI